VLYYNVFYYNVLYYNVLYYISEEAVFLTPDIKIGSRLPEDGISRFPRNVRYDLPDYTVSGSTVTFVITSNLAGITH